MRIRPSAHVNLVRVLAIWRTWRGCCADDAERVVAAAMRLGLRRLGLRCCRSEVLQKAYLKVWAAGERLFYRFWLWITSFHSVSERFPFLDRNLRFLSRASSWLRAQGYAVGKLRFPPRSRGCAWMALKSQRKAYTCVRGLLVSTIHLKVDSLQYCKSGPFVNGDLHSGLGITWPGWLSHAGTRGTRNTCVCTCTLW